jgi:hypothetical protein
MNDLKSNNLSRAVKGGNTDVVPPTYPKMLDICPRANWIGSTNGLDRFDPLGY